MNRLKIILSPLAVIYFIITSFRNSLFKWGVLTQYKSSLPVLSIGNLSMGGTGKTPHVAFVLENTQHLKRAVISRGYGRKNKKLIEGNSAIHTSKDMGDEPMELLERFEGNHFKMIVEGKRAKALQHLESHDIPTDLVILDDGLQHQYAHRDLNVLLTEHNKPFYKDFVFPMGTLREHRNGAKRADIIIVTKCPENMSISDREEIISKITPYSSATVLFTKINHQGYLNRANEEIELNRHKHYLLVTGIANPKPLYKHLDDTNISYVPMKFPDHHNFSIKDLKEITEKSKDFEGIITTEKDWMRLRESLEILGKSKPIFRLKIGVEFIDAQQSKEFNEQLHSILLPRKKQN